MYPEEGKKEETKFFYDDLQKEPNKVSKKYRVVICGELNARIGNQRILEVVGTFGEQTINDIGQELSQFGTYNDLKSCNSLLERTTRINIHGLLEV